MGMNVSVRYRERRIQFIWQLNTGALIYSHRGSIGLCLVRNLILNLFVCFW